MVEVQRDIEDGDRLLEKIAQEVVGPSPLVTVELELHPSGFRREIIKFNSEKPFRDYLEASNLRKTAIMHSPDHIRSGNPVLITALVIAGLFGLGCIYAGIQLMGASGSGLTTFKFPGLSFTTQQAGVASIGLGAIVLLFVLRRAMKTIERLGRL